MNSSFQHIVVVGAGAVGSYFGAMLARASSAGHTGTSGDTGHTVTLIGRAAHVAAINQRGLHLHKGGQVEVVRVAASTTFDALARADLVLFCVKSSDTESVARQIAPLLRADVLLLSLQNGVDNAATIAQHVNGAGQTVLPAVVYVATAMPEPGAVAHYGRGDLVVGLLPLRSALPQQRAGLRAEGGGDGVGDMGGVGGMTDTAVAGGASPGAASSDLPRGAAQPSQLTDLASKSPLQARLEALVALFASANVPVRLSDDVMGDLWRKLLVNCAYNAISAVTQTPYGHMAALAEIRQVMLAVVREVVAVAQADGMSLTLDHGIAAMDQIAAAMPGQFSSTAQDLARGKPSEIDHLNGFVMRRGAQLGIATPVNQTLHALVKLVEAKNLGQPAA